MRAHEEGRRVAGHRIEPAATAPEFLHREIAAGALDANQVIRVVHETQASGSGCRCLVPPRRGRGPHHADMDAHLPREPSEAQAGVFSRFASRVLPPGRGTWWRLFVLALLGVVCILAAGYAIRQLNHSPTPRTYWGAWIAGSVSGGGDAPWDMRSVSAFERQAGKRVSIIHFGQPWYTRGVAQPFYPQPLEVVREHGAIPLVDWGSWDSGSQAAVSQPAFSLARIVDGSLDWYIRRWAIGARDWGHPFFLRFDHEMNGDWFPWAAGVNGNTAAQFVAAWRHVHDLFEQVGATNVTWVWSPVVESSEHTPLAQMYPGSAYVDWVAMDGYNYGTNPVSGNRWLSFASVFEPTYVALQKLAPSKPIMIAEVSSSEYGGSKASWIKQALSVELPRAFARVKALVWFNSRNDGDWPISTSASSRTAFAKAIASPYFTTNNYRNNQSSPIKPVQQVQTTGIHPLRKT
jgi:hypothetical protein